MNNKIDLLTKPVTGHASEWVLPRFRVVPLSELGIFPGEIANGVTHCVGFVLSIAGATGMLFQLIRRGDIGHYCGCIVFLLTMVAVYLTSTCSHIVSHPARRLWFRQLDQGVIYLFIAGSYTPWALMYSRSNIGLSLLSLIWLIALTGFISKIVLSHRVNRVCLILYLLLAWLPVLPLKHYLGVIPMAAFAWLLLGGLCYMAGTIFWKLDKKQYHFHAIWHVLVMLGTLCHYIAVFNYAIP